MRRFRMVMLCFCLFMIATETFGDEVAAPAAPKDAVVLIGNTAINVMAPGALEGPMVAVGHGLVSKEEFGDAAIHVEFKCPYEPSDEGQARGNSGVYVQGRYEIQVLDSFGDPPAENGCGGIYGIAAPLVNASLAPGEWQTYDITFTAPRFDADGKKTANARITVEQNGKRIHDDLELPTVTAGGVSDKEAATGPLFFQNHGDAVEYRNIWVKPL